MFSSTCFFDSIAELLRLSFSRSSSIGSPVSGECWGGVYFIKVSESIVLCYLFTRALYARLSAGRSVGRYPGYHPPPIFSFWRFPLSWFRSWQVPIHGFPWNTSFFEFDIFPLRVPHDRSLYARLPSYSWSSTCSILQRDDFISDGRLCWSYASMFAWTDEPPPRSSEWYPSIPLLVPPPGIGDSNSHCISSSRACSTN